VDTVRPEAQRTAKPFREQLADLQACFTEPSAAIPVGGGNVPPLWLLGSSPASAELAGELGLPYAFAHHLNPDGAVAAVRAAPPQTLVSVSVIAAEDDERAEWLAGSTRLKVLSRIRGNRILLPSPDHAAAYPYTDADRAEIAARSGGVLVGSPETVAKHLQAVLDDTGTDELMITTPIHDHAARRRSYELIAGVVTRLRTRSKS
jgi:luciferase family oxidoreductase group 1